MRLSYRARWRLFRALPGIVQAGVALGFVILCALILFPGPAKADAIARHGADWVQLTEAPCTNEAVLQQLGAYDPSEFKAASAELNGQHFDACWRTLGNMAHLIYSDGDQGVLPLAVLTPLRQT